MRFSSNSLRTSIEAGTTSSWLCSFEDVAGSEAPSANGLNLIISEGGNFFPAQDIDYAQANIETKVVEVGPGIKIEIPVYVESPTECSLTYFETHQKDIRAFVRDWVEGSSLKDKQAPSNIKKICLKLIVWYFDKELKNLDNYPKDVFYVYPKGALSTRGDQAFALDTNNLNLVIAGVE